MKTVALVVATLAMLEAVASAAPTPEDFYTEGQAAYDRADYTTAIAKWQVSYQLSGVNALLFNLAQAMRLSGDCASALSTYKRFVAVDAIDPASEQHKLADDFTRELEPKCGEQSAPILEPPKLVHAVNLAEGLSPHKHEGVRPGRTLKVAGLVTGGVGAASITVGLGLGHHAATLGDEVTRACSISCDWSVQKENDTAGRRDAAIGYALDVLGAAAIAGGAIMYYLGNHESEIVISPRPRDGGAVISWSGSW